MATNFIDWSRLRNPVHEHVGWSVKDACMVYFDREFFLFYSAFYHDDGRERSHVVCVKTRDFITYSEPLFNWSGKEGGWIGLCSPNISKIDNTFYLAYNSWGDKENKPNQLFCAVSRDLESWEQVPLAASITRGKRAIDAAIARDEDKFILFYKQFQVPIAAWSETLFGTPWHVIGKVNGARTWFENAQLIEIDGTWNLVCKTSATRPCIAKMEPPRRSLLRRMGDGTRRWLGFSHFQALQISSESFNTRSIGNAPFLSDFRENDGYFYLLYAGSTESQTHAGRGDNRLGLARSRDLHAWQVPPA